MTARNEDPNFMTWLRDLQSRVSKMERNSGVKNNDVRLNDIVLRTDAVTNSLVLNNLADGTSSAICWNSEIVFSWSDIVDELGESGPWHVPFGIIIDDVIITARLSGASPLSLTVYGETFVLPAGSSLVVHKPGIRVPVNNVVTAAITDFGAGDVTDVVVTVRYTRGGEGGISYVSPLVSTCGCIPDVMGSADWVTSSGDSLAYQVVGDYYYCLTNDGACSMYWPTEFSGAQSVEVTATNFGPRNDGGDWVLLWCRSVDLTYNSGILFSARKYEDVDDGPLWEWYVEWDEGDEFYEPVGDFPSGLMYWPYGDITDVVTFRLESDVDGAFRVFANEISLYAGTYTGQPVGPSSVGFGGEIYDGDETASVHISDVCVNGCNL